MRTLTNPRIALIIGLRDRTRLFNFEETTISFQIPKDWPCRAISNGVVNQGLLEDIGDIGGRIIRGLDGKEGIETVLMSENQLEVSILPEAEWEKLQPMVVGLMVAAYNATHETNLTVDHFDIFEDDSVEATRPPWAEQ